MSDVKGAASAAPSPAASLQQKVAEIISGAPFPSARSLRKAAEILALPALREAAAPAQADTLADPTPAFKRIMGERPVDTEREPGDALYDFEGLQWDRDRNVFTTGWRCAAALRARSPEPQVDALAKLVTEWREAANSKWNRDNHPQVAATYDECADDLAAALRARSPEPQVDALADDLRKLTEHLRAPFPLLPCATPEMTEREYAIYNVGTEAVARCLFAADKIAALPALRGAAAPGTGTCRVCKQQFSTAICSACWVNGEDDAAPAQVDAKVGEAIVEAQEAASAHGYCCRATEILSRHIGVLIAALRARSASLAEHHAEAVKAAIAHLDGTPVATILRDLLAAASPAPTQREGSET